MPPWPEPGGPAGTLPARPRSAAWRWVEDGRLRGSALDARWALALHRRAARPGLLRLLVCSSRLGDAAGWLLLALLLPLLDRTDGVGVARQILLLGTVNLVLYAALKFSTRRARPFECCDGIQARIAAADRFSFPSGHTLHAVAFAVLLSAWYPAAAPLLGGFAALVALSRVVLGVHYPSDVLAGALIGFLTAGTLVWLA